jgi:antitoxin component of MazEF toxin-antitoxin module
MRTTVRRIGNSLGVIIPRSVLEGWQIAEGGELHISESGIFPARARPAREVLDEHKRRLAAAVASRFTAQRIRAHSLANLHRWRESGAWVSAYDEWRRILEKGDDGALFAAMLGSDDQANRLRQSPPYVGLLPRGQVARLNEEAAR